MPALVVTVMLLAPMTALLTDVPANNSELPETRPEIAPNAVAVL